MNGGKATRKITTLWVMAAAILLLVGFLNGCASLSQGNSAGATYNPPKPEDAPENIRDAVILGRNILSDTQKTIGSYVGNDVKCANCHFKSGLTQGGKNGGLSLTGVAAVYPKYRDRQKYAVNLVTRVND